MFPKITCIDDLEALNIGRLQISVGPRGGYVGFTAQEIIAWAENNYGITIPDSALSRNYGVYCNYLGGGVRGVISGSGHGADIPQDAAALLDWLAEACRTVYMEAEGPLNEDYEDGETNWDALATKQARRAGIESAY